MKVSHSLKIFIYTALPCEAKPLSDYYQLKKDTTVQAFSIFRNDDIALIVTGIGKTAMAAGIAYSQALFSAAQNPVMLNIGIAGHKGHAIGSLFIIDKITDADSGRRFYPPLAFTPPCLTTGLQTAAKPQHSYPQSDLCDMEASAFYETATRFTASELCQCLKIVSDNESAPAPNIQAKHVSELIAVQLPIIEVILTELTRLSELIKPPPLVEFNNILSRYHFTVNEQIQLKKLLSRLRLIDEESNIEPGTISAKNGKEFLMLLHQQLNMAEFYL
jgi:nucleoside phosphorylase